MLVLPAQVAASSWPTGISALPNDTSWELFIHGSASLMAISSIAFKILQFRPVWTLCWTIVGFTSGFLAKKTIGQYSFGRSISRAVVTCEDRLPYARIVGLCIALLVSVVFPTISAIFAAVVGACAGYLFRAHRGPS